jgi:LPPG:FO 2-phospho-L-lactate transferase
VYAVLAGGVGAARFLRGLTRVVPAEEVVAIVNVGDDLTRVGLRICPDLDSITYWLAGVVDPERQWGRADESHVVAGELERFGYDPWFTLGDRDLGVHLHRTMRLHEGAPLSQVTAEVVAAFGVDVRLLPATDDPVETRIATTDGRDLHFQEYWVGERGAPDVAAVRLAGGDEAVPGPGVVEALLDADAVLVAPSNPVVSIDTIVAVPGILAALHQTPAPVVGVSPIVGGEVVRGMAHRLLPAVDAEVSAVGVARHYGARGDGGLLDGWVIDERDRDRVRAVRDLGLEAVATDSMMDDPDVAAALARTCLEVASRIEART